jgi:hypothetical protein
MNQFRDILKLIILFVIGYAAFVYLVAFVRY